MIKSLETLIKVNKQKIDDLNIDVTNLDSQISQMNIWKKQMNESIEEEYEFIQSNYSNIDYFESFKHDIEEKINNIEESIISIEQAIKQKKELIIQIYTENKKYEILKDKQLLEISNKTKKLDIEQLNEISLNSFYVKKENND